MLLGRLHDDPRRGSRQRPGDRRLPAPLAQDDLQVNRPPTAPPGDNQDSARLRKETVRKNPLRNRDSADFPKVSPPVVADTDRDALPQPILKNRNNKQLPLAESAPQIVPAEVTVPQALEFLVSGPSRKQVGGSATFHLTLSNSGDRPLEGLAVRCGFDDALSSPAPISAALQRVERLAVGESKDLALACRLLRRFALLPICGDPARRK